MPYLSGEWQSFFKNHLDRVYCVICHLAERLPELAENKEFADLRSSFRQELSRIARQQQRLESLYRQFGFISTFEQCQATVTLIEDAFTGINLTNTPTGLRELSLIFYLETLESLGRHSLSLLERLANPSLGQRLASCTPLKTGRLLQALQNVRY